MRLTKTLLCLVAVALFSFTTLKSSRTAKWHFLADKRVGFGVDHDVINFGNWGDDVSQIKIKVTDGPLKMYSMTVHFDNGGSQDVALRLQFAQGSESRVIDLDGGLRHLSSIEFTYETKGFLNGRSRVAVWGK